MDARQESRLQILEAVAAVLADPIRFLTIVNGCQDIPEATECVMREYDVTSDVATQMLATNFRRATSAERAKLQEEIERVRQRLTG